MNTIKRKMSRILMVNDKEKSFYFQDEGKIERFFLQYKQKGRIFIIIKGRSFYFQIKGKIEEIYLIDK